MNGRGIRNVSSLCALVFATLTLATSSEAQRDGMGASALPTIEDKTAGLVHILSLIHI